MSTATKFAKAKDCSEQKEHLSELKEMPVPNGASNCLSGCTFVMTGTLPALTRAKAKQLIEKYGGKVASSINAQTNIILKGYDEETSKKLQDAKKKGIPITDQEGLFKYIASTDPNNNNEEIQEDNDNDVPESSTSNNIEIPEIKEYIDKICDLQTKLLTYIDDSDNVEENYQNLAQEISSQNISKNKRNLTSFFRLINKISNHHFRTPNFFSKIEKVLTIFENEIKQYYSNKEIFNIFKNNKRILLYLVENKLIKFDEYIIKTFIKDEFVEKSYPEYFKPEIKPFLSEDWLPKHSHLSFISEYRWIVEIEKDELPENFEENRKNGENENTICQLIQKDSVKEFIVFVNKEKVDLKATVKSSIYETNTLLLKNNGKTTLIEYAIFYGAIQILRFLLSNDIELKQSNWIYEIHGQNSEIIHILEENKIELQNKIEEKKEEEKEEEEENDDDDDDEEKEKVYTYEDLFFEAIKCHHNEVANYIIYNLLKEDETNSPKYVSYYLRYYNLSFNRNCVINDSLFCTLCKYNYYEIVDLFLKHKSIDVNKKEIYDTFCLMIFYVFFFFYGIFKNIQFNVTPLYAAVEKENIEIVRLLLMEDKTDVNATNKTLLFYKNCEEFYEWCEDWDYIHKKFYINVEKTALYLAIEKENVAIVNLLLMNNKIDVNMKNKFFVYYSAYGGDERAALKFELTSLNLAIEQENIEIVKLLLIENSIDINLVNFRVYYGNDVADEGAQLDIATPLCSAIEKNNTEIVKLLLLNNNVDVNIKLTTARVITNNGDDLDELTPLDAAIKKENFDIVNLLLNNNKLDVNSTSIKYARDNYYDFYYSRVTRKTFANLYDDRKRYIVDKIHKNLDLIQKLVNENKIELNEKIRKLINK